MNNLSNHPLFLMQLLPFVVVIIGLILRFIFRKKKISNFLGFSCLIAIFLGLMNYFYFGFPLDEGTIKQSKIPEYEFKFSVTAIGLAISFIYPVFSLLDLILSRGKDSKLLD
ncbi:MAG: hypothetical protein A3D31_16730 [Candidatus Fluviicola riflensis]|nr:MAG: hypothetical protein CHH17_01670 [Candidatus Fluviicola riflensis]OGS76642.1 MAG: hypothetical protein A3D31_16730 [Candidatus Fluviicola riflensis]OGS83003.1 MAG: hypothetical protein A2724_14630 [Fluviicola sp. RIFCSPHIGHO2_01_FULL_43_53]OGS88373.1 MAG: hypothetical protein A3E30_06235 [Fluviicola sp. RIFCSPHIGHO2_12_FULL_43_24]